MHLNLFQFRQNRKINKNSEETSKSCYIGLQFYNYALRIL